MELKEDIVGNPLEPRYYPSPTRVGELLYYQEGRIGVLTTDSGHMFLRIAHDIFELAECDGRIYSFCDFENQVWCVRWSLTLQESETLFVLPNRNRNMVAVTIGRSGILVVENRLGMANTIKRYNLDGQLISNTPLNLQQPLRDVCHAGNNRILLNYSPFALPVSYDLIQGAPVNVLSSMNQQLRCLTSDLDGRIYGVITLSHTHRLVRINRYTGKCITGFRSQLQSSFIRNFFNFSMF